MSAVIWLTGMSGAGKTSIATGVEEYLKMSGQPCLFLDGDRIRAGLSRDLGFSDADRAENVRRVAEVARLLVDNNSLVIVALISPSARERETARQIIGPDRFHEVFVNAPLHILEQRDVKGLYVKARAGRIKHFTGIDSVYESPSHPALRLNTHEETQHQSVQRLIDAMRTWLLL